MRYLSLVALIAMVPTQAMAQCPIGESAELGAKAANVFQAASVSERNAQIMKAALGGDDTHATDADLD
jgi:hypothetical protein